MTGTDWVALLRGINVGTAKRIAMTDLREIFTGLGYVDVATLLVSGNVVFSDGGTGPDPARLGHLAFEQAVLDATGVQSAIALVPATTFLEIAAANPLRRDDRDPRRLAVAFAVETFEPDAAERPDAEALLPEELVVTRSAVYQWLPNGTLASTVPVSFWRSLGGAATSRNDATVRKIASLVESRAQARQQGRPLGR
jgi:uncharacterized protein (DUF1697 family)